MLFFMVRAFDLILIYFKGENTMIFIMDRPRCQHILIVL